MSLIFMLTAIGMKMSILNLTILLLSMLFRDGRRNIILFIEHLLG
jgi:hypothetical protein